MMVLRPAAAMVGCSRRRRWGDTGEMASRVGPSGVASVVVRVVVVVREVGTRLLSKLRNTSGPKHDQRITYI